MYRRRRKGIYSPSVYGGGAIGGESVQPETDNLFDSNWQNMMMGGMGGHAMGSEWENMMMGGNDMDFSGETAAASDYYAEFTDAKALNPNQGGYGGMAGAVGGIASWDFSSLFNFWGGNEVNGGDTNADTGQKSDL